MTHGTEGAFEGVGRNTSNARLQPDDVLTQHMCDLLRSSLLLMRVLIYCNLLFPITWFCS